MPDSANDHEFLKDLFKDLDRKVEEGYLRLETKIEHLHSCVENRIDGMTKKVNEHEIKIAQHSHTFNLVGVLVASFGTLTGILASLWGMMPWNHK